MRNKTVVRLLVGLVVCSVAFVQAQAQKGVSQAVEAAVNRQVLNRAKLPTLRDGVRNLVTRRLGNVSGTPKWDNVSSPILLNPTRSALDLEKIHLTTPQEYRKYVFFYDADFYLTSSEDRIKRHEFFLEDSFDYFDKYDEGVQPGSGNISAIALEPYSLIDERKTALENWDKMREMEWMLNKAFVEKDGLQLAPGYSFERVHKMIRRVKDKCPFCASSDEISMALDVLEIQTWMLAHEGEFPQVMTDKLESSVALKFEKWMEKIANEPEFANKNFRVQALARHLVHLRAVAKGTLSPEQVILQASEWVENGRRIPGSSLELVTFEENALTKELNYVEQLRKANLLSIVVPMEQKREALVLCLQNFQEKGHIYKRMIEIIPEFAYDGVTLNVPTRSYEGWEHALQTWQQARAARKLSTQPRTSIRGRLGLPVNFNDLTPSEQEEVLLGTYLRIKGK